MDRLLQVLLQSKAVQMFGFAATGVTLGIYLLCTVGGVPWKIGFAIGIGVLLAFWAYSLFLKGIGKSKVSAFEKGLVKDAGAGGGGGKAAARKASSEVAKRWSDAITELKKAGMDLYTLPWYLLIGEPQSGKSTTLKNSGLEFPVGTEALSGAGGTRNCDWWFTNEAIVLDTAGRFTFQEKNAPDQSEWKTFLSLLKSKRPRCPINGVILVIPCTSLLGDTDEVREQKAVNIREKLQQLQRELGVQFPVFILITKSDQILGFTEFFNRLSATDQRQLFGWSMHGPFIQSYDPAKFYELFDTISHQVHKLRLKLLSEDLALNEIDKLYVFPEEFKSIREPLHEYLKTVFVKTHYLPALFFRGFYFTSGLQEGKPIAKAVAGMIRNAGPAAESIIEGLKEAFARSRAFFIRDFYIDKLFPERNLVIHSVKKMGVNRKLAAVALVASVLLVLGTVGGMGWSILKLKRGVGGVKESAQAIKTGFVDLATQNRRGFAIDELKHAPPFEATKEAIERSATFSDAVSTANLTAVSAQLRDMHWLYFIQNVLHQQGRALYAQMLAAPGKSVIDGENRGETAGLYDQYIPLWSLNNDWINRTAGGSGGFDKADFVVWDKLISSGPVDQELQNKFGAQLDKTRQELKEPLDFSGGQGSITAPVQLNLVPGSLRPRTNQAIKQEIDEISARLLKVPSRDTIDSIVDAAKSARDAIDKNLDGLVAKDCGYIAPIDDPFVKNRDAANSIRKALDDLRKSVPEGSTLPAPESINSQAIEEEFRKLQWIQKAPSDGAPRQELDSYITEQVTKIKSELERGASEALAPLKGYNDLIDSSGKLTPQAEMLREGVDRLLALADAQGQEIKSVREGSIDSSSAIGKLLDAWRNNKVRLDALAWAGTKDLPTQWKIQDLATRINEAIADGDESVKVEAWIRYITTKGEASESKLDVSGAALGVEPPSGAKWEWLKSRNEELDKISKEVANEFTPLKDTVQCVGTRGRLQTAIDDLAGINKRNQERFLGYWRRAYDRWEPCAVVNRIPDWSSLQSAAKANKFADALSSDLKFFVENVDGFKEDTRGSLGELQAIFPGVKKFYEDSSSVKGFSSAVTDLGDNIDDARKKLFTPRLERVKAGWSNLEAIKEKAPPGKDLNCFPRKIETLLGTENPYIAVVDANLRKFFNFWLPKLGDRFPFQSKGSRQVEKSGEVATVRIPQVSADQLKEFYFGGKEMTGLLAIIGENKDAYDAWREKSENAAATRFIDECLGMKDYFFGDGQDYQTLKMRGIYTGFAVDEKTPTIDDLGNISEEITLVVPASPSSVRKIWRTRYRDSSESSRTVDFDWKPGSYSEKDQLQFESSYQFNKPTDNTATLRVPDDFALLAYIYTSAAQPGNRRRWDGVTFTVEPKFKNVSARNQTGREYKVTFSYELLGKGLPELPDWNAILPWLKK